MDYKEYKLWFLTEYPEKLETEEDVICEIEDILDFVNKNEYLPIDEDYEIYNC